MADGNEGGADNSGTGTLGVSGQGTGQTAEPGLNPTGGDVQGNDTTKVNDATGREAAIGDAREERREEKRGTEEGEALARAAKVTGEGDYDVGAGAVRHGEVEVEDGNGVKVTKRAG